MDFVMLGCFVKIVLPFRKERRMKNRIYSKFDDFSRKYDI